MVFYTKDLDSSEILDESCESGLVTMTFHHGPVVAIGLEAMKKADKKDSAFIHHLALSMLPPLLPSILSIKAMWKPAGWPSDKDIPQSARDGWDSVIDAWQGLTLNEGNIPISIKRAFLDSIDDGLIIANQWSPGSNYEQIHEMLEPLHGSKDEKILATHMLLASMQDGPDDGVGLRIDSRGEASERNAAAFEVIEGASVGAILSVLWEKWGIAGLEGLGITGREAEEIWRAQHEKSKPFGTFLKGLDAARQAAERVAKFPTRMGEVSGNTGQIHDLILTGILEGKGKAERMATKRHNDIDSAACAWSWLLASGRSGGQEWHFEANARDKAGAWLGAVKDLLAIGEKLVEDEASAEEWNSALDALRAITGEA